VRGFVSDHDIEGHFKRLMELVRQSGLRELWDSLTLEVCLFEDLGWSPRLTDRDIWTRCQKAELILITNNRNHEDETSLQATINAEADGDRLPVLTIGNINRFQNDRVYANAVAEELIQLAFDVRHFGTWLGAGRVFLPQDKSV
jgi:hypothetical protein